MSPKHRDRLIGAMMVVVAAALLVYAIARL